MNNDLQQLDITLSDAQTALLHRYLDLLHEANQRFNLTAVRDRDEAWRRHVVDSLTVLPFIAELPADARLVDVGSGAGLPGIPLAIARPDLKVTLLEATGKKANFCQETAAALGLTNVVVVNARAETAGRQKSHRQRYDAAVARALGPLREMLEYLAPLVRVEGLVLSMKGPKAEQELEDAGDAMHQLGLGELEVFDAYPPSFGRQNVIVLLRKIQETHHDYPRPPGMPRQAPL